MNFDTPAELYSWFYDHLYVYVAQVRAKGLVCKKWLEEKGPWSEDFRSLGSNMQFTLKGGRTLLRLGRELMDSAEWYYHDREYPPEPIFADCVALSDYLCDRCKDAPILEIDYFGMSEENAFKTVYWAYVNDGRKAIAYMRHLQNLVDEHEWEHNIPVDTMEFHINDVQSRIQWGWRCSESNFLGALTNHNIKYDRDEIEMQAKRRVKAIAKDLTPERDFCPTCKSNIIIT